MNKRLTECNDSSFDWYDKYLFGVTIDNGEPQIILNHELWNKYLFDIRAQRSAISVIKNESMKSSYKNLFIINQMLLDYMNLPIIVYSDLVFDILNSRELARIKVPNDHCGYSEVTLLERVLLNPSIGLENYIDYLFNEVCSGYYDNSGIYGLKYLILKNRSVTQIDKSKVLNERFNDDEYNAFMEDFNFCIANSSSVNGNMLLTYDEILFEDVNKIKTCLNNNMSDLDSRQIIADINCIRELLSIKMPSYLEGKRKIKKI